MELIRIRIRDIRPNANNPRKSFDDIDELAATFKLNPHDRGEPLQPIVTVRDGNVFRIVDGERRFRAMKSLGAIECWSNVCDSFAEGDAVVQMLATNNKRQLTDVERSIGVQTMLLLGVEEKVVESAGGVKDVKRIKRAMDIADRAPTMTIDHLLAIAEADEAGDEDAVEALGRASLHEWSAVAQRCERKRRLREACDEMTEAARQAGFSILDGRPKDGELGQRRMLGNTDADELKEAFERGYRHILVEPSTWGETATATVWMDEGCAEEEPPEDPEAAAQRERAEAVSNGLSQMEEDAHRWLGRALVQGAVPSPLAAWFDDVFPESELNGALEDFERAAKVELAPDGWRPAPVVAATVEMEWPDKFAFEAYLARGQAFYGWMARNVERWIDFYRMVAECGWEPPEYASELIGLAAEGLEAFRNQKDQDGKEDER